jgi:biopolymer transport protein ExbD
LNFRPRRRDKPDLNMTSLIDVVLLLFFFMPSTRFVDESRLAIRLPEASLEPARRGDHPGFRSRRCAGFRRSRSASSTA